MPYWRSYYHLVWATSGSQPLLTMGLLERVGSSIRETATNEEAIIHAIGGTSDHVHVLASIPPKHAVAYVVGRMRGASAHAINASGAMPEEAKFAWQSEYGVTTFGEKALADVCRYVNDQENRHTTGKTIRMLENIED